LGIRRGDLTPEIGALLTMLGGSEASQLYLNGDEAIEEGEADHLFI